MTTKSLVQYNNPSSDLNFSEKCLISNTSAKKKFICKDQMPCKQMTCKRCRPIRKCSFKQSAIPFSLLHSLNTEVSITWPLPTDADSVQAWSILTTQFSRLNKKSLGKHGKFIRVIALGRKKGSPHVHYLINESKQKVLRKVAKELNPNCIFHSARVNSLDCFLGYLFDQNFIPTHNHPNRPKRIRVISSSRGCRTGFPPIRFGRRA